MRRWLAFPARFFAGVAVLLAGTAFGADTFELALKQIGSPTRSETASRSADRMFMGLRSQHFFVQTGERFDGVRQTEEAEFSKVVKKEPAKYVSKHPFRGVAELGTQRFGFVLDEAVEEKPQEAKTQKPSEKRREKKGGVKVPEPLVYGRLFFDLNHNGDLTDDPVIEATDPRVYRSASAAYASFSFPRVELTVDAAGTRFPYAFFLHGYCHAQKEYQYAAISLNAAAYRDGHVTLDGKKRRVVLVDFNSNGRFDDVAAAHREQGAAGSASRIEAGDMIYLDPDLDQGGSRYGYDPTANDDQQYVAELIAVDGKFYELEVSPAGEKISLSAATVPVGYVTNPNKLFRAIVVDGRRVLKVSWNESGKSPLPEGNWKLASYTIDATGTEESVEPKTQPSLLKALVEAFVGSPQQRRSLSVVSARAPGDYPAVKVREGETVELPFGPPYEPVVKASGRGRENVSLGMSLIGSVGESCTNLVVDGRRPSAPEFTISGPDDKVVQTGRFKYG